MCSTLFDAVSICLDRDLSLILDEGVASLPVSVGGNAAWSFAGRRLNLLIARKNARPGPEPMLGAKSLLVLCLLLPWRVERSSRTRAPSGNRVCPHAGARVSKLPEQHVQAAISIIRRQASVVASCCFSRCWCLSPARLLSSPNKKRVVERSTNQS